MLPAKLTPDSEAAIGRRPQAKSIIKWMCFAIVFIGACFYCIHQSLEASKVPDTVIHTDFKPTDNAYGISVGITDIIISQKWSFISGNNPTITFRGLAETRSQKLQYVCFIYRPLNDPIWTTVDARKMKDGSYRAKIRDAKHNTDYACYIAGVTKDNKYSSHPLKIHIP